MDQTASRSLASCTHSSSVGLGLLSHASYAPLALASKARVEIMRTSDALSVYKHSQRFLSYFFVGVFVGPISSSTPPAFSPLPPSLLSYPLPHPSIPISVPTTPRLCPHLLFSISDVVCAMHVIFASVIVQKMRNWWWWLLVGPDGGSLAVCRVPRLPCDLGFGARLRNRRVESSPSCT